MLCCLLPFSYPRSSVQIRGRLVFFSSHFGKIPGYFSFPALTFFLALPHAAALLLMQAIRAKRLGSPFALRTPPLNPFFSSTLPVSRYVSANLQPVVQ